MIGVVGKLKVNYYISETVFEDIIDFTKVEGFSLSQDTEVYFKVEEVNYIEDTIYGATLSLVKPYKKDDEYFIYGGDPVKFEIPEKQIRGTMMLSFF